MEINHARQTALEIGSAQKRGDEIGRGVAHIAEPSMKGATGIPGTAPLQPVEPIRVIRYAVDDVTGELVFQLLVGLDETVVFQLPDELSLRLRHALQEQERQRQFRLHSLQVIA